MKLFLSYATRDTELGRSRCTDLERLRTRGVAGREDCRWAGLVGPDLSTDRSCDAVVFAISPSSVRSRYCERRSSTHGRF